MAKKETAKKEAFKVPDDQDGLINIINKLHGAGSIMIGSKTVVNVESFSTGVPSIDVALGCGGIPIGRIIEIYGPESSGKTTTCLQFIAACQKHWFADKERNGVAAFIDAEHAIDAEWARKIGVDVDSLLLSQPNSGDEAFSIIETIVRSRLVDLVVVDSVAALTPEAELRGEITDANVGAQARLMSKGMRKLTGHINKSKCTVIFINQIREKIGVMFGSNETTPGGRALKFHASIRCDVRRGSALKSGDDVLGFRTSIKMVKNKVAAPFVRAEYDICTNYKYRQMLGIDCIGSLVDVACQYDVISRSGTWYSYNDIKLGNGLVSVYNNLRDNKQIFDEIRDKTYDRAFSNKLQIPESSEESEGFDESDESDESEDSFDDLSNTLLDND